MGTNGIRISYDDGDGVSVCQITCTRYMKRLLLLIGDTCYATGVLLSTLATHCSSCSRYEHPLKEKMQSTNNTIYDYRRSYPSMDTIFYVTDVLLSTLDTYVLTVDTNISIL